MKYNIGQILTLNQDIEVETVLSTRTIRKGSKAIVCADGFIKHDNGMLRPLGDDNSAEGYDLDGIAEWIYRHLRKWHNIDEFLDEYEIEQEEFIETIAEALRDIGFKEG